MEDDLFYQKGNKFTPKELKDCPECGNKEIDELIRYTQLNATQVDLVAFIQLFLWKYLTGFRMMVRSGPMNVALKRLDNSQNISSSYINQITDFNLKRRF
ncbi:hypothetical protein RIR_jg12089.t1 [Rhizophagus irregularis DAOM 181602=DAOM 197198]|uniref:Uncharacterized protein n=1 Tax=Rhizophagus irregularis (strain DAOM 181602 / DAOM 197198 / MUCL 43194) TaxID=747089 RepID=A0A2P4QTA0_RHIID|nr:hypothetical protein GLOIN_2v1764117 [Rhizophagus irregularis DAOM 181602=DAOM 197198]POG80874.1 hypothetical protein GLOIN_2v1764117 [Rhizophagus irregularis DAOM 181602=DAOM 197198]GET61985.1 hypothetical protein RIR_jg12089.t1 [Rhizophagus irregularis DAOM 181602=DAOM 197198]CAG8734425.1 17609_t:CDS:2 [Rhizophagus irregularis]|eukprot:XP_025187740.1 hypothetical protein GLOIN_2v1764117 [Rhizophagus irregularis DAOM 181602=DAOM 197198]